MPTPSSEHRLTEVLRQGDPLQDDPGLGPEQSHRMRRTILNQAPEATPRFWPQLSPALSVAALLALALGAAWWPTATHEASKPLSSASETTLTRHKSSTSTPTSESGGNALENRKIQFETPGGTLVVWVLNPNFPS